MFSKYHTALLLFHTLLLQQGHTKLSHITIKNDQQLFFSSPFLHFYLPPAREDIILTDYMFVRLYMSNIKKRRSTFFTRKFDCVGFTRVHPSHAWELAVCVSPSLLPQITFPPFLYLHPLALHECSAHKRGGPACHVHLGRCYSEIWIYIDAEEGNIGKCRYQ